MSVSKMSKKNRKQRLQTQNQIITSVGCLFVVAVSAFSVIGTKLAINNINREAQDMIVYAKQQMQNQMADIGVVLDEKQDFNKTEDITNDNVKDDVSVDELVIWSDAQVKWMEENQIRYNEYGQPVDVNGNVVVDPTIQSDDSIFDKSVSNNTLSMDESVENSDTSSQEKPETNTNWGSGKDWLTQTEDGDYLYVVQCGDMLSSICEKAGFSLDEIVAYNQITNPDVVCVGQTIRFPQAGPKGTADNTTFGLG